MEAERRNGFHNEGHGQGRQTMPFLAKERRESDKGRTQ
jgi:hypothetical protein